MSGITPPINRRLSTEALLLTARQFGHCTVPFGSLRSSYANMIGDVVQVQLNYES